MDRFAKITRILDALDMQYSPGKDTINLNCPFCIGQRSGEPDTKGRCGVFPSTRCYCVRCDKTYSLYQVTHEITGVSWEKFKAISGGVTKDDERDFLDRVKHKLNFQNTQAEATKPNVISLPVTAWLVNDSTVSRYPMLQQFMDNRRITLDTAMAYEAFYDPAQYRFGWPIYHNNTLVGWQGRDITNRQKLRYFSQGKIFDHVYFSRYQTPGRYYVVEGVLDDWRMEENAIASFNCTIRPSQQEQILQNDYVRELVFAWDSEMWHKSKKAAQQLAPIIKTGAVRLPDGKDPDELGEEIVKQLPVWWA